ncbi:MAG: hypothetical protein F6K47_27980 [Symploca sp. SIO2E6]|nr:hypothetical protein [Symploca sp. SIO2E6]
MNRLSLILLSGSTVVGSLLMMSLTDKPAKAAELDIQTTPQKAPTGNAHRANLDCERQSCTGNAHLASFTETFVEDEFANLEKTPEGHLILEFTEEESNAAIAMFGCDCVKSLNAVRQMRGVAIGVEGNIILPGPEIKPCNQPLTQTDVQ